MTTFTTSVALGDNLGKTHEEVLQVIKTLPCSDVYRRQNIEAVTYHDAGGELQVQYRLSRDATKMVTLILIGNVNVRPSEPPGPPSPALTQSPVARALRLQPVRVGNESIQTVNAKDLHAWLGVGKDFSTWLKGRIETYKFVKNQDYVVFPKTGEKSIHADSHKSAPHSGRPEWDVYLTLDMAKQLSMVERTAKGQEARLYFILGFWVGRYSIRKKANMDACFQGYEKNGVYLQL
ncbi:MAG: antA/AntB antirepressor family protein [Candidatus Magnetobacterium sp. LHC-1]